MYESTMEALEHLYPRVSDGGFIVVDDYGALPNCRAAVEDFRRARGIAEPVVPIDWTGAFWQKGGAIRADVSPNAMDSGFDEERYLALNPDVAQAVEQGHFHSGREHFSRHGRAEGRRFR
jgi:hypothetical protein